MHLSARRVAPGEPAAADENNAAAAAAEQGPTLMQKSAQVGEEIDLKSKQYLVFKLEFHAE